MIVHGRKDDRVVANIVVAIDRRVSFGFFKRLIDNVVSIIGTGAPINTIFRPPCCLEQLLASNFVIGVGSEGTSSISFAAVVWGAGRQVGGRPSYFGRVVGMRSRQGNQ